MALAAAGRAIEMAHGAEFCRQIQKFVSVQSLASTCRLQGLPQPASLSSLILKQRRMQTVCMAHPRRVAMVTRQIERDVGMLFSTDPIILSAISPEYAFGCELMTCMAWVSKVEVTSNLQCARVYFSVFSDQRGKQIAIGNLKAREKYVRMKIAQSLNLRRAPEVRLIYNDTDEREELKKKKLAVAEERERILAQLAAHHKMMKRKRVEAYINAYNPTGSKQDEVSSKQEVANSIEPKTREQIGPNTIESKREESDEQDSTEYEQTSDTEEESDQSEEQDTTEDDWSDQTSDSEEDSDETDLTESDQTSDSEEDSDETDSTESDQTSDTEEDSDETESDTEEETDSTETSQDSSDSDQSEEDVLHQR